MTNSQEAKNFTERNQKKKKKRKKRKNDGAHRFHFSFHDKSDLFPVDVKPRLGGFSD